MSESVRTWTPQLSIAVGRARPTAAPANSNYRQSDDGRPVDALRTASAQGLTESRQDYRSEAVQSEAGDRLAGNCNDGEQPATARHWSLAIIGGCLPRGGLGIGLMGGGDRLGVYGSSLVFLSPLIAFSFTSSVPAIC